MAFDTLMVYAGVYGKVEDAEGDYQLVKDLHTEANLIDAYDAAVIERREDGKVKIVKKHETPTRVGGVLGGGIGLRARGLVVVLFPFAAVGGGLLAATTAGGAILGAVTGPRGGGHETATGPSSRSSASTWTRGGPVSSSSPCPTWARRSSGR